MQVLCEVDRIAYKIIESGGETSDFVILSTNKYRQMLGEHDIERGLSYNSSITGYQKMSLVTVTGHYKVLVKSDVPADHISIGRITLMDFYIEDVLLGEVDSDFGDY